MNVMIVMITVYVYSLIYFPSIVVWEKEVGWCGRWNNGPQRCLHNRPRNLWVCEFPRQGEAKIAHYLTLQWEQPGLSRWAYCNHKGPLKQKEEAVREVRVMRCEKDSVYHRWLWGWRMGTMSQRIWVAATNWKKQRNGFSLKPAEKPLF